MKELDEHITNVADYDCFSQIIFQSVHDYKRLKEDPYFTEKLMPDHLNFADVKRSKMTIGWVTEVVRNRSVVDT